MDARARPGSHTDTALRQSIAVAGVSRARDVSTDPAHARPYLKAPTSFPEQEVDFAKGTASIGQVNIQVIDVPTVANDQKRKALDGRGIRGPWKRKARLKLAEELEG